MDDHMESAQSAKSEYSKFASDDETFDKNCDVKTEQLKKLMSETSVETLIDLNGKSSPRFDLSLSEFDDSECNNFKETNENAVNTYLHGSEGNKYERMKEKKQDDFFVTSFDNLAQSLSESLDFSVGDSSSSVRRDQLYSISDNEEDFLEVTKDLAEVHSFGSPGGSHLDSIEACNFRVKYHTEAPETGSMPLLFEARNERFVGDVTGRPESSCAVTSEDCASKVNKELECHDSISDSPMLSGDSGETSYKNVYDVTSEGISANSSLYECASISSSDVHDLSYRLSRIERSSSPLFKDDPLRCETTIERRSPALVHTRVHPVVSIEITAPPETEEEYFRRGSINDILEGTETDFLSDSSFSNDRDSARSDVLSSSSSHFSEGIPFSTLSVEGKQSDADQFITKGRSHSFGEIEGGPSWRNSASSDFGDAVDNPHYDSDVSGNSSSASRPVSPSENRLFSKVHAKVKNKRKKAAQYFKSGHGDRRNSDSAVFNECSKKIFLEVPGESSDFNQTIMETNLVRSSDLSKSDSRLNEKKKPKPTKKRRLSESRVIVKLKGLKNKKHHGSNPSMSGNAPQEVTLSPDPFAEDMRTVRAKSSHLAPREVDFQHSETYYANLKLAPPASRSRSPTPVAGAKKTTSSDVVLPDIAIDDYYEKVESIYDEPVQEPHVRKPFFSLEGFRNVFRGKSRSVDHTSLASSFPIDSLRRSGSSHSSAADSAEGSKENVAPSDKSSSAASIMAVSTSSLSGSSKVPSAPTTTTTYTVEGSDTLMSIAARFDTTPSELTKLNRLSSRYLFPGQSLLVPLRSGHTSGPEETAPAAPLGPQSNTQGSNTGTSNADVDRVLDQECLERFLKLQVRHVTDGQGIVGGVLLVTPNAIMFDPDVSDPLVLERGGADTYGFICPMECLANAAIYSDIATMRVKDTKLPPPELPKPEIFYCPAVKKSAPAAGLTSLKVDLVVGGGGSVDSTFELVDSREAAAVAASTPPLHNLPEDGLAPSQASRKQKVLKRLSNPLSWMDSLGSDGGGSVGSVGGSSGGGSTPPIGGGQSTITPHHPGDQMQQGGGVLSSVFNMTSNVTSNVSSMLTRRSSLDLARRSSPHSSQEALPTSAPASNAAVNTAGTHKRAQYKDGSNVGFRSLVPVDDVTNLFSNVDKMVGRKSTDTEEAPLYLCLRMGLPKRLPRSPFLSYGTKIIKAEYWFSIPRSKAPDLCRLLDLWGCGIYGEVDEQKISERGLTLILEDTDLSLLEDKLPSGTSTAAESSNGGTQLKEITKESWEAPMSDDLRRLLSSASMSSVDIEAFLPEMLDPSEIVDHQTFKNLYRNLPPRFQSYSWHLTFSTAQHGFSLSSLYRKMQEVQDSPVLLAVQDTQQTVFGALLSNSIKVSDGFYGTGESFIFTCYPSFQVCNWTAENTYFIKGNNESLVIGGGDHFGIWLDGDLYRGRSQPCKTYNNPVLGPSEDFVIKTIECWSFV